MPENIKVSWKDACLPRRKRSKEQLSALICANADGTHKLKSVIIGKAKMPKRVKEDTSIIYIYIYKGCLLHRRIIFRLLLSKFCSWHQAFFNFMKTTQRSVNSGQFSSSSFCLTNEDGQTKYKFFTWNTSILIQAMNQDIILSRKQLHRWKQLEESCNFERKWEWRGKKIKRQFPRLKSTKYEYKKEPVCHL